MNANLAPTSVPIDSCDVSRFDEIQRNKNAEWIMKEITKQSSDLVIDYCHTNHP